MTIALILLGAYLLGAIPFGVLICRAKGVNLFKVGSGNIGATNVYRAVGAKWAGVAFILDVLKGFGPTILLRTLFPAHEVIWMAGGATATLGHCFSPFLRFRGGKGVACLLGMVLGVSAFISAWALGMFLIVFVFTRIVSLSSLIGVPTATFVSLATHQSTAVTVMFGSVAVLTIILHRQNIRRLLKGVEPKFGTKKPESTQEHLEPSREGVGPAS